MWSIKATLLLLSICSFPQCPKLPQHPAESFKDAYRKIRDEASRLRTEVADSTSGLVSFVTKSNADRFQAESDKVNKRLKDVTRKVEDLLKVNLECGQPKRIECQRLCSRANSRLLVRRSFFETACRTGLFKYPRPYRSSTEYESSSPNPRLRLLSIFSCKLEPLKHVAHGYNDFEELLDLFVPFFRAKVSFKPKKIMWTIFESKSLFFSVKRITDSLICLTKQLLIILVNLSWDQST